MMSEIQVLETLYENPLAKAEDLEGWRMEGDGLTSFPRARLRLESARPMTDEQDANIVFWCPHAFPDHIRISWDFQPLCEPGLAIIFFAAKARAGGSIFDDTCAPRRGPYNQYHSGDINALHISYFRRRNPKEMMLHTCNLRKSHGFHLVAQGANAIPDAPHARRTYRAQVVKSGPTVMFAVEHLSLFAWTDPGSEPTGPVLTDGHIGLRQMSPLIAEYANLVVERIVPIAS